MYLGIPNKRENPAFSQRQKKKCKKEILGNWTYIHKPSSDELNSNNKHARVWYVLLLYSKFDFGRGSEFGGGKWQGFGRCSDKLLWTLFEVRAFFLYVDSADMIYPKALWKSKILLTDSFITSKKLRPRPPAG